MSKMQYALPGFVLLAAACASKPKGDEGSVPDQDVIKDAPELQGDEATRLVRRAHRNVQHFEELRRQGETQQMVAMRRTIGETVDRDFATFSKVALYKGTLTPRNMAVTCIGFAIEKHVEARRLLLGLLDPDEEPWILANAALALSILRDKDTDLTKLVRFCGHGDVEVRTNCATALGVLFRVKPPPRELTPQYYAAIDRLVALLHDRVTKRGRRAAAWALANLHHPEVLDHLVSALQDDDQAVQIGGLYGIEQLGDQRALEALFEFLEDGPTTEAGSWAKKALVSIAVQGGFTKTPSELDPLGTDPKKWRKWFRAMRNK